jgi:hypothetical protein
MSFLHFLPLFGIGKIGCSVWMVGGSSSVIMVTDIFLRLWDVVLVELGGWTCRRDFWAEDWCARGCVDQNQLWWAELRSRWVHLAHWTNVEDGLWCHRQVFKLWWYVLAQRRDWRGQALIRRIPSTVGYTSQHYWWLVSEACTCWWFILSIRNFIYLLWLT